jgi:hypothetical protein
VCEGAFIQQLQASVETALSASRQVLPAQVAQGWRRRWLHRFIASAARLYLRLSGSAMTGHDY